MVLNCVICDSSFTRYGKQALNAKTCSLKCMGELFKGKPNTKCSNCNKDFHMKESAKNKYKRSLGFFCSIDCSAEYKKIYYRGEGNHQYGLKGDLNASFKGEFTEKNNHNNIDLMKYVGFEYPKNIKGRVLYHRYLVQENYKLFNLDFFDFIDGRYIIKNGFDVHHKDNNHNNNSINNLEILTRSEHTSLHNNDKIIVRGEGGKIKTVKNKQ